jgi:cbb3-type cytochrome oxidase subunit 3
MDIVVFNNIFREMPKSVFGLAVLICVLTASPVHSLGLGRIEASSHLGQPLRAQINVIMETEDFGPEDIRVRQLTESEAGDLGIDLIGFNPRFLLAARALSNRLVIDITSRDSVDEPFLNILIELRWPAGTVYREYTMLLDPVSFRAETATDRRKTTVARIEQKSAAAKPVALANLRPGGGSYQVRSGDSLSRIAGRVVQGTDLSRNAMMQWLLQNNPRAFIGGEMDKLLAGAKLRLPADSNITVSSTTNVQPSPPIAAKKQAPTATSNPSPATTPRLSIVTPNTGRAEGSGNNTSEDVLISLRNQVVETTEIIESLRRENEVMRERLRQLEESDYVASLEKLVGLKEREVDLLRQQLQRKDQLPELAIVNAQSARENAMPADVSSADKVGAGQQWWLILLLMLSLIGAVFFFLRWRSPSNKANEAASLAAANEEILQELDNIAGTEQYFDTVTADVSLVGDSAAPSLAATRNRRDDATVKRSIVEKTRYYHPPDQMVDANSEHDDIDDIISRAITLANRGEKAQAEALLAAERNQQARVATGDSGDIDSRLEAALHYIQQL